MVCKIVTSSDIIGNAAIAYPITKYDWDKINNEIVIQKNKITILSSGKIHTDASYYKH